MLKLRVQAILVLGSSMLLNSAASQAQTAAVGSMGGGGAALASPSAVVGESAMQEKTRKSRDVMVVEQGAADIGQGNGVFVWLEADDRWQVQWVGSQGELVWVRMICSSPVSGITGLQGENYEQRGPNDFVISDTATEQVRGVTFTSAAASCDLDAKWGMRRTIAMVAIGAAKTNPTDLPIGLSVKGKIESGGAAGIPDASPHGESSQKGGGGAGKK